MQRKYVAVLVCTLFVALPLLAGDTKEPKAPTKGFRAEFLQQVDDLEKKIVGLAEATPADKYTWRPADGVRSISEVYMHIAGGNFFIPTFLGVKLPEGVNREMEKIKEKEKVIAALKQSFQHAREVALSKTDEELDQSIKLFGGQESTVRGGLFLMASHLHEHLGQSIAYARMNGIVPPWSQ